MDNNSFLPALAEKINHKHEALVEIVEDALDATVQVDSAHIVKLMTELKEQHGYNMLFNVTAVDYPEHFAAVYTVVASTGNRPLTVKAMLAKDRPEIDSLCGVFKAANVQERETYDLMGIRYLNHPNLTRVLLPDDFTGHPLRKDYAAT
ncbi:MAG: hypothetical protein K0R57_166 [Paenibacillaceae bacterium]|jgi:NADH-quinone oxidoreductase subunit C|nr:hypothetical protein [Paenibacillaceae bacterium]